MLAAGDGSTGGQGRPRTGPVVGHVGTVLVGDVAVAGARAAAFGLVADPIAVRVPPVAGSATPVLDFAAGVIVLD